MKTIAFGNSGLVLSQMGLGLAALGRPGYINLGHRQDLDGDYDEARMEHQTHEVLNEALRRGVNYFDAAQSYGKAELFLSSWLRQQTPKVVVGSKWGYYYTAGWSVDAEKHEVKEHTRERLDQQWPESRQRLAPHLRLYQIHSATFESGVLENIHVLERLEEIRSEGYVIGLSLSGPQQAAVLEEALKIIVDDSPLFGSVQATYNILEQAVGPVLQMAADQGLGVIIKEGVANGRLTARNLDAPYFPLLEQVAQNHQVGVDAIAIAYILQKAVGHVVLSGAATTEHLTSNLQAANVLLTDQEIKLLDRMAIDSQDYWGFRSQMAWN